MLGLAVCAALALSGCLGYDGDFDRGYQVDENTLSQVKVGTTTKPEALALLGTRRPLRPSAATPGTTSARK